MVSNLFLAVGKVQAKYINLPSNHFLHTNTSMADKNDSTSVNMTNAAECKYEFVHTELVQVFYVIKWISSGAFEFKKKQQQIIPKN